MSTKKNFWIGLPMQMMYGLVLGVIVGTMVSSEFGATYLQPLGQLFIRLIRMVVVPLVVATLIAGSAGLGDASKIGKIAVKTILFFAITTAIAVTIGLIVANFMEPGTGLTISVEGLKAKAAAAPPFLRSFLRSSRLTRSKLLPKATCFRLSSSPSSSVSASRLWAIPYAW